MSYPYTVECLQSIYKMGQMLQKPTTPITKAKHTYNDYRILRYLAVWTLHVHHELARAAALLTVLNVCQADGHQGGLHQLASTRGHHGL